MESSRVQQRGACLLAARGLVNDKPCDHCAAGLGRFMQCITLGNWFRGACSSCIFTSKGNRCSFRSQRGQVDGRRAKHRLTEEGGMIEERQPGLRKRKRHSSAKDPQILSIVDKTPGRDSTLPNGKATIGDKPNQSPAQHSIAVASSQTVSPDMDSMLQAEIADGQPSGLLGYVHEGEKKQKRYHVETASSDVPHDGLPQSFKFKPVNSLIRKQSAGPTLPLRHNHERHVPRNVSLEAPATLQMMETQFQLSTLFPNQSSGRSLG